MPEATLNPDMTMEEILRVFPSAQRALFQRYHVGGCSSCAFQPGDTLAEVCRDHNLLDVNEVVDHIRRSQEMDENMQLDPKDVSSWLAQGEEFRFIDVRTPQEIELACIPQAEPLDFTDQGTYMNLPKDTKIVFSCKSGMRSLDVAAYFAGHGFTAVYSLRGGIDAWRADVDPSIPTY
jgi:rhodanese-related sulfurtransferase